MGNKWQEDELGHPLDADTAIEFDFGGPVVTALFEEIEKRYLKRIEDLERIAA